MEAFQTHIRTNSLCNSCWLTGISGALDIFSDEYNFIIEEGHIIITGEALGI